MCPILSYQNIATLTPVYNIIIYLRLFNYIYNVENDNALRSHNFSPFFRFSILTSAHTRCSYGYHAVFRSMTVFFYVFNRQALLLLHVNDQLVINCNDSRRPSGADWTVGKSVIYRIKFTKKKKKKRKKREKRKREKKRKNIKKEEK